MAQRMLATVGRVQPSTSCSYSGGSAAARARTHAPASSAPSSSPVAFRVSDTSTCAEYGDPRQAACAHSRSVSLPIFAPSLPRDKANNGHGTNKPRPQSQS
eukprot:1639677-Rhodomonas_salina.4